MPSATSRPFKQSQRGHPARQPPSTIRSPPRGARETTAAGRLRTVADNLDTRECSGENMALAVRSGVPTPQTHGTKQCLRRRTRSSMTNLPDELLENIEKLLDHHTTLMLSMTCRRLNQFFGPRGLPDSQYFKLLQHCATTFSQHKNSILCHACVAIKPGRRMIKELACLTAADFPRVFKQCLICEIKSGSIDPYTKVIDVCFKHVTCPRCKKDGRDVFCTNCHQCSACLIKNPYDAECGAHFVNDWGGRRINKCKTPYCYMHGVQSTLRGENMPWPHVIRMPASQAKEKGIDESNVWSDGFYALSLAVHLPEATREMRRAVGDEKIQYKSAEATSLVDENEDRIIAESDARTVASTYSDRSYPSNVDPRLAQPVYPLVKRHVDWTGTFRNSRSALPQDRECAAVFSERVVLMQLGRAALQGPLQAPALAPPALAPSALAPSGSDGSTSSLPGQGLPAQTLSFPQPPRAASSLSNLAARRLQPLRQAPTALSTPQLTGTTTVARALSQLSPATQAHLGPSTPANRTPQTQPRTPLDSSTPTQPSTQPTASVEAQPSPQASAGAQAYPYTPAHRATQEIPRADAISSTQATLYSQQYPSWTIGYIGEQPYWTNLQRYPSPFLARQAFQGSIPTQRNTQATSIVQAYPVSRQTPAGEQVYRLTQAYLNGQASPSQHLDQRRGGISAQGTLPGQSSTAALTARVNATLARLGIMTSQGTASTPGAVEEGGPAAENARGNTADAVAGGGLYTAAAIEVEIGGIRAECVRATMEEAEVEAEADVDARS